MPRVSATAPPMYVSYEFKMIATRTLWRYRRDKTLETVEAGERCDWAEGGVYEHLGWAVKA